MQGARLLLATALLIQAACAWCLHSPPTVRMPVRAAAIKMGYVLDGLTKEQWAAMKQKDVERERGKDYGAWGVS